MANLAGRTVYGNGSYAPTRGPVSASGAQGYLARELRKKQQTAAATGAVGNKNLFGGVSSVGGDGQSDTRSGAAASLLAKQGYTPSVAGTGMGANVKPGGGGGRGGPIIIGPQDPKDPPHTGGNGTPINPKTPLPMPPGSGPGPSQDPTDPPNGGGVGSVPTPPQVSVNPDGTLNLPYDSTFGVNAANATAALNQRLLELQLQQQQHSMDYAKNLRDYGIQYDDLKRGTLNNAAATGSAYSSAYGNHVAENSRAYNNQMSDLNGENNMFSNWILQSKFGIQNDYNGMMQAAASELAQRLQEQAFMHQLYLSQNQPGDPAPADPPPADGGGATPPPPSGGGKKGGGKKGGGGHGGGGGNGGGGGGGNGPWGPWHNGGKKKKK